MRRLECRLPLRPLVLHRPAHVVTQLGGGVQRPVGVTQLLATDEHGVGVAKKSFLPKFAGDAQMRVMRELRKVLDPAGILNPGKMFD